jgi:hypothetical protein
MGQGARLCHDDAGSAAIRMAVGQPEERHQGSLARSCDRRHTASCLRASGLKLLGRGRRGEIRLAACKRGGKAPALGGARVADESDSDGRHAGAGDPNLCTGLCGKPTPCRCSRVSSGDRELRTDGERNTSDRDRFREELMKPYPVDDVASP